VEGNVRTACRSVSNNANLAMKGADAQKKPVYLVSGHKKRAQRHAQVVALLLKQGVSVRIKLVQWL
jgi:hypothetical protein